MGAAGIALVLLAAPARAEQPSDTDRARAVELRRAGAAATKARQWDACIRAYVSAQALEDTALAAGDLGLCEEQAGRFADAHRHLDRALAAAPAQNNGEPWKRYRAAMTRVLDRVAIVFLTVTPTEALVVLDSSPIGQADGRYIAVEPGKHTISARLEGHEDATRSLTVSARDLPYVHLALTPLPAAPPGPDSNAARKPPIAPATLAPLPAIPWYAPTSTPRGAALVVGAVAGATALVAIVSGGMAIGLEVERASLDGTRSDMECAPGKASPPRVCASLWQVGTQRDAATDIAIGTGIGAAVLGGIAVGLAFGLDRNPTSPRVAPMATASGGGIVVLGAW